MHRLFVSEIALLILLTGVAASVAQVEPEIAPATVRKDVFPQTIAQFPGGVVAQPNVEFANLVGFRPLLLDLYRPERSGGALPLVVWIHGGGFSRGDSRTSASFADWPGVLASLAAQGYVVASVNYRLSGEARFPAAIQDVNAAIHFLRANAAKFAIDPSRVILWGGSAGGHLAALAATTCGLPAFEPQASTGRLSHAEMEAAAAPAPNPTCVQGAVIWYGIFEVAAEPSNNAKALLGCQSAACPDVATLASPLAHVTRSTPPMLLIHGAADKTASPRQSERMAESLRKAGAPVETLFIPGAAHGWIGATPEATREASLLALRRSFDFISRIATGRVKPGLIREVLDWPDRDLGRVR